MIIYEGDTIILNGEEIKINQAETADLLKYLDDLPSWDEPETETVARELCDRLDVNYDAYSTYDELYDALAAIHDGKGPIEYHLCSGGHECRSRDEAYDFDVGDYRDHEINDVETFYSKSKALRALSKYGSMILDHGNYYSVDMWFIQSHDLRDDYWDIEDVAEMVRED